MGEEHDRILKNQRIISRPFRGENPSEVTEIYWIHAENNCVPYPASTKRSGKWLIFINKSQIDQVWRTIKQSLEYGELGSFAKVSTSLPNPNAQDPNKHVICVYTYDSDDVKDVMRIRQKLRELGITQKIPYKTDKATLERKYAIRGHKKISKYYE